MQGLHQLGRQITFPQLLRVAHTISVISALAILLTFSPHPQDFSFTHLNRCPSSRARTRPRRRSRRRPHPRHFVTAASRTRALCPAEAPTLRKVGGCSPPTIEVPAMLLSSHSASSDASPQSSSRAARRSPSAWRPATKSRQGSNPQDSCVWFLRLSLRGHHAAL